MFHMHLLEIAIISIMKMMTSLIHSSSHLVSSRLCVCFVILSMFVLVYFFAIFFFAPLQRITDKLNFIAKSELPGTAFESNVEIAKQYLAHVSVLECLHVKYHKYRQPHTHIELFSFIISSY